MTNRGLRGKKTSMNREQVNSPQHQVNLAASLQFIAERQERPSSSCRAKAADKGETWNTPLDSSGVWGSGTLTRLETELGRPSLAITRGDQQVGSISHRVKGADVRRESESGVVLRKGKTTKLHRGKARWVRHTLAKGVSGGHGGTPMTPNNPKRREPLTKTRELRRKLWTLAKRDKNRRFHALYDRIHRWDVLTEAWRRVRQNRGSSGVDQETIEDIEAKGEESFLREVAKDLKEGSYRPKPVRRVMIPKSDGRKRPLGIPTVKDRVIQMATKLVIEPIFEADFKGCSYGFRPRRSALQALERIRILANKGRNIVLDADIKDYFGSIRQEKLMSMIGQRISDRRVLKLIRQWLRAGVMEEGIYKETEIGTPQGGVISPLLSNVYLNQLDREWEERHASWGKLTRYADDFVVQCVSAKQAEVVKAKIRSIFRGLGLTLHPEKTRIVDLRWGKEGFDFLGHHLRKMPSYRFAGKFFLNRWPSQKALKRMRERLGEIIHRRRFGISGVKELVPEINRTLQGWRGYFQSGNANRQFSKIERYLWDKLSHFECKRRFHQAPYRSSKYDWTWYKTLGIIPLLGSVKYPNPSLVLVKANA